MNSGFTQEGGSLSLISILIFNFFAIVNGVFLLWIFLLTFNFLLHRRAIILKRCVFCSPCLIIIGFPIPHDFIMKNFKHISKITELYIWIPVCLSPRFYHHDFFVFPLLYMYPYITLLFIINPPFYFLGGIFHCKLQTLMHFPLSILVSR